MRTNCYIVTFDVSVNGRAVLCGDVYHARNRRHLRRLCAADGIKVFRSWWLRHDGN